MDAKHRPVGVVTPHEMLGQAGLDFLQGMIDGRWPQPPMTETLGFRLHEVALGRAVFAGEPQFRHYNPLGTVHAGFALTLLDSALACSVHTTLAKGEAYVTLEIKANLVRALTQDTGRVIAEGRVVHRGRTTATAEGKLKDASGKLYAHATTTCMIFPAKPVGLRA
jgi:uncharacterized protein (TIGR00369 family)